MKINDKPRRGRAAFTLIELLVVIAIIAVLVSLTAAAVMKFLSKGDEVKRRSDITQMKAGLGQAKTALNWGSQLPSRLRIREDGKYITSGSGNPALDQYERDSQAILMAIVKTTNPSDLVGHDWNGNGQIDGVTDLTGDQCLVFFLGGIPSPNPPGVLGFSTLSKKPTAPGGDRTAPFFQFQGSRLQMGANGMAANGFFSYLDPYGMPYAYFSSYKRNNGYGRYTALFGGSDCMTLGVSPYQKTVSTFWNEGSFQIISAGPDKTFGPGGVWGVNNPAGGAGADDMSDFANGLLGSGQ